MSFSPDSRSLSFTGQEHDPHNWDSWQNGLWVYDLATGKVDKLLDGVFWTKSAWSVDSRKVAVSTGERDASQHRLIVVDTKTHKTIELNINGASPVFSPNGRRLAYLAGESMPDWYTGEAVYKELFVVDRNPDVSPVKIELHEGGLLMPQWSPDGAHILYLQRDTMKVCVGKADGSASAGIYTVPLDESGQADRALRVCWAPSGNAVYVLTSKEINVVAADGSGVIRVLRLDESSLPPGEQAQTLEAAGDVQEAIFQYAVGFLNEFHAMAGDSLAAYQTSADLFGGLMWKYPLAQLSADDVLRYADRAARWAGRTSDQVISDSCWQHLRCIRGFMGAYYSAHYNEARQMPVDMKDLEDYTRSVGWHIGAISNNGPILLDEILTCPKGGRYVYKAPNPGKEPNYREVIITCPNHPEHRILWRPLGLGPNNVQPFPAKMGPILESDRHRY